MTIAEIKQEIASILARKAEIEGKSSAEKRGLNADEINELNNGAQRIIDLRYQLAQQELEMPKTVENKKNEVSIRSMISRAIENKENELNIELREGEIQATAEPAKGIVSTNTFNIETAFRANSVLGAVGATIMTGLKGNITIPIYSGSTSAWAEENAAATNGKGSFTYKTLSPKRLTSVLYVSKQLLLQDTVNADKTFQADLIASIMDQLDKTIFGNGAATTSTPGGIFKGVSSSAEEISFKAMVDMETALDDANATSDKCMYIFANGAFGLGKITPKAAGQGGFIVEGGQCNGYKAIKSSNVYKSGANYGVAYGDFRQLAVGSWGNIELTIDTVSMAEKGLVKLVVNSYWDAVVKQDGAIAKKLVKAPVAG